MQVADKTCENDGEKWEAVLTITATAEEVDKCVEEYFKELAQNDVPGFRKGKAPRHVLEQGVGGHDAAYAGAAEKLVNSGAFELIDDADVIFLDQPSFNVDSQLKDHEPFTFTVSGEVEPQGELSSYDPVHIEMPPERASDKEVDDQIQALREYYYTFEDIEDAGHKAEMGDYAMVALTCTNDGAPINGLADTTRLIGLGEGTMPESFDEKVIGAKVGDTLSFDFEAKGMEDKLGHGQLHAELEVKSFRRKVIPELDDEFAKKQGAEDVAALRTQIELAINMEKEKELPGIMEDRCVRALAERLEGEVPEYYVDFKRQGVIQEMMQQLKQKNTNLQDWMLNNAVHQDELKEGFQREAENRARNDMALEALFAHEGLEVTDADVDAFFAEAEDGESARRQFEESSHMADARKMIRQNKAADWLVEHAVVDVVEDGKVIEHDA